MAAFIILVVAAFTGVFQPILGLMVLGGLGVGGFKVAKHYKAKEEPAAKSTPKQPNFPPQLSDIEVDELVIEALRGRPDFLVLHSILKSSPFRPIREMRDQALSFLQDYLETLENAPRSPFPSLEQNKIVQKIFSIPRHPLVVTDAKYPPATIYELWEASLTQRYPSYTPYANQKRFEHTQIVGGSGAGKTTLLSHLILHDLKQPNPPCIILIDPKNLTIPKLSKLALFDPDTGPLRNRLIILSPEYKPSINIFDNAGRGTIGAIDSLKYLCSALSTEFTTLQEGLAANIARLLLVFPQTLGTNATLADLRALMVDKFPEEKYGKAVEGLRPAQQEFFKPGGFDNSEYRDAKRQIRRRLDQMIGSEYLESLFYSQRNAIDIAEEMQKGSIILVDCAERLMDTREESAAFGAVFIAEIFRAIQQRNAIPEEQRRPCFLFVDEAATFFRGDMNYFFEAARQCHVGGTFAFHYLSQKNMADLRETMMAMTSTKLVSHRAKEDANAFAIHMGYRGSPSGFGEFLDSLPPYHFALSIAGVQEKAVGITAPPGELESEPPMSDAAYARLLDDNRKRVSADTQQQRKQQQHSSPPPGGGASAPPPPPPNEPKEPPPRWTEQDEQALADAEAQRAIMRRRKNWARVDELGIIIAEAEARKKASNDYYGGDYHL